MQLCHMCCARNVLNLLSSCAAIQRLSHLGFCFCFFFYWEFDGRIKNLNPQNSFVSKIFKGWAFFILVKLVD